MDDTDAGNNAAAGNMPPFLLLIGRPAVEPFFADVVPGVESQFEKIRSGIDQHPDEFPHRLLALLREALRLDRASDLVGLLAVAKQERVLLLPVLQIRLTLLLPALRPRQTRLRLLCHILSSLPDPRPNPLAEGEDDSRVTQILLTNSGKPVATL